MLPAVSAVLPRLRESTLPKLTKVVVDRLKPAQRDVFAWDSELRGFGVRVLPSGVKSWVVQYRNRNGQQRRYAFARVGVFTPEQARKEARAKLVAVADGKDPSAERKAALNALTVAEACDEYLVASKGRVKASTLAMDRSRINVHVKPLLGAQPVASLRPRDIEKFLADVIAGKAVKKKAIGDNSKKKRGGVSRGGAGAASRTVGMLGTILERAVRDGLLTANPVRGVKRPKDKARKPPFSFDVLKALGLALKAEEIAEEGNKAGAQAVRLLLLTGFRRMEGLALEWDVIDVRARCVRFADTKSGAQIRPIGRAGLDLLETVRPEDARGFVFPADSASGHLVGLPRVWARIAKRAKIEDVSLHGLRHWFASAAAEMNYSELTIAGLLGHKVKGVTARYATTPDAALLAAADAVSARIAAALEGKETDNVVNLSERTRA
jgi:integrase